MAVMSEVQPVNCDVEPTQTHPRVRLFVAGDSPSSRRARRAVEAALGAQAQSSGLRFEVVDVLREPERALESKLLATPTLIIEHGGTVSRYVGDLYQREDVAYELAQAVEQD
ncbi:KaiB domain protein [Salinisphaera sp. T5B8]